MKILEGPLLSVNYISNCTYKHSSKFVSHSVMSDSMLTSSVHGILRARIPIQESCHSPLQGIFPTPGWNPSLLRWRQILYPLSQEESPVQMHSCKLFLKRECSQVPSRSCLGNTKRQRGA